MAKREPVQRLTVTIPVRHVKALEKIQQASYYDITLSEVVRKAVEEHIDKWKGFMENR